MTDGNHLNRAIELFNLEEFLIGHGARPSESGQWALTCPICGRAEKLIVHVGRRVWHCWACEQYGPADPATGRRMIVQGAGGLISLVQLLEGVDRAAAAQFVIMQALWRPENIEQIAPAELAGLQAAAVELTPWACEIPPPEGWRSIDATLPYMIERGISLEDARCFGLFWCDRGRYAGRLIFPVWEAGRLVYYQGRAMHPSVKPKSLNPPKIEGAAVSSELVLNLDTACRYPRVAVCEGPVDAVHAGPSAVCVFGKRMSATQIGKLLRAGVKAIDLMFDGPSEKEPQGAWPEMLALAPVLAGLFDTRLVFLPRGDPGEWPREALDAYRAQAKLPGDVSRLSVI